MKNDAIVPSKIAEVLLEANLFGNVKLVTQNECASR